MMWGYNPGWGGWLMMSVGMVVMLVLLGILVWTLIRWLNSRATPPGSSALEILQQRYARGEIDDATYERMREHLQESAAPPPPTYSTP